MHCPALRRPRGGDPVSVGFKHFLIISALVSGVLFSYWNVDKFSFIDFDDGDYVYKNQHIFSGFTKANIKWAFSSFYSANWHPLTWFSHMLDYRLYGLRPAGHHLTNLFFHVLNTVLLFFALKSMTGTLWRSALVAALFGLHPLHVESVAWVSERKDVLCAFFMFITLLCYSAFVHRRRHWEYYFATLFFFMMGLMSKPMIVTLPFVLLLCDFWPFGRLKLAENPEIALGKKNVFFQNMPLILEKIPFFFLSLVSCIVTAFAQKAFSTMPTKADLPLLFRLGNSLISYMEYIVKTVWPRHLSFFYPLITGIPQSREKLLYAGLLLLFISLFVVIRFKKQPFLPMGWFWFLGTLVPAIGLVQVGSQAMADRYTYIPLIGLFIIISWLLHDLVYRIRWLKIVAVSVSLAVLVLLALQTRKQAGFWKNNLALSEHALAVTRYNFFAYSMQGSYLLNTGSYEKALRCFSMAHELCPAEIVPKVNIGCVLLNQGKTKEALDAFKAVLATDSTYVLAYLDCGKAFAILGKRDSAIICFSRALAIDSLYYQALYHLGKIYEFMGDFKKSIPFLQKAGAIGPNDPAIFFDLGNCCFKSNRFEEAGKWYEKTISLSPNFVIAHRQLAMAMDSCGKHDLAKKQVLIADSISAFWKMNHPAENSKKAQ
jgi:tetratricopeptide (TPR) repeat protein